MSWFSRINRKPEAKHDQEQDEEKGGFCEYTLLRVRPTRGLPGDLAESEQSEKFLAARADIEVKLLQPDRRPPEDAPLFWALLAHRGPITVQLPDSSQGCLLVFSSPIRAEDYRRALLATDSAKRAMGELGFLSSSPSEFVEMLSDLRQSPGIEQLALDRCPRCEAFTSVGSDVHSAEDAVRIWAIFKATELARTELYGSYALAAARRGEFEVARDVALELVGHVTPEDPRAHSLLGKVGIALGDKTLVQEATDWLRWLGNEEAIQDMEAFEQSAERRF
jgi:hypothetical protein